MEMTETRRSAILAAARRAIEDVGGVSGLAADLLSLADDCGPDQMEDSADDSAHIDVRLQLVCIDGLGEGEPSADSGDWTVQIWTGIADYDTDHRGFWGAGSAWAIVTDRPDDDDEPIEFHPMTAEDATAEAQRIIDEALDYLAFAI